jgi:hypothetical protein
MVIEMANKRDKKPVSRIDNSDTHGWFARVYRDNWVRGRMFSDGVWGGRYQAEGAAWSWVRHVDRLLPRIPRKPVLKIAKFTLRKDSKGRYYDVYLPLPGRGVKPESRKFHFKKIERMELQAAKAHALVVARNVELVAAHRLSLAGWKRERDKTMIEILKMWTKIKK